MKFYDIVLEVLKQDKRFFTEEGELLRNSVYEAAMRFDKDLIKLLLSSSVTREKFFIDVNNIKIFDKMQFGWVINNKELLPDSFTRFKNKIGLVNKNGGYISESTDVELVFPYKDCVLEGGQTREDRKHDEIFYNETLTSDEVDRLLYPKVFTNPKRYTKNGVEEVVEFRDTDNLVIKGNNLLALSSLLKRYESRVKCIYIDPPFNTGNDGFKYNDSFNHSTWLTFIKNRLSLAKQLLRNDGFIFIEIDSNELHYLKCLCDDIFGRENFINDIVWKRRGGSANPQNRLNNVVEFILCYTKSNSAVINPIYTLDDENTQEYIKERFTNEINGKKFMLAPIERNRKLGLRETLKYEYNGYIPEYGWMVSKENLIKLDQENRLHWNSNNRPNRRVFLEDYKGQPISNLWTDIKVINPMSGERLEFDGQKPEKLLERILSLATEEKDLIMDFYLGTGTTAAVAHKMNRQYICVEQMDYIETITIPRLKNVINGDLTGISQSVNWQGGGSFIYCELKCLNQMYVDLIQDAKTEDELWQVWQQIISTGFICSLVSIKEIDSNAEDYQQLSFKDKKRLFMTMLDKNMLYVTFCDIDDEEYAISEKDKAFTRSFYRED